MSVKGKANKAAGYVREEAGEMMNDAEMAVKGRAQRNKGRIQDGEFPKVTPVGSDN